MGKKADLSDGGRYNHWYTTDRATITFYGAYPLKKDTNI